jgi:hypothetical protein
MRDSLKSRSRSFTVVTVAALAAGLSSVLLTAAPASATPFTCGVGGTSIGGGVCQLTYNSGTATFTPPAGTSKLEALLVGGGGDSQYGYGGGGGEVVVQNFADTATAVDVVVGADAIASTTTQGATTTTAHPGENSFVSFTDGGASGNGNLSSGSGGAGAGAGTSTADGGAGQIVSALAPGGSLFAGDTACFGGGGAVQDSSGAYGLATCGGGSEQNVAGRPAIVPAVANTGGGGGTSWLADDSAAGATGVVIVRWLVPASTVTFVMDGHGTQVPTQEVITGTTAAQPADPTATGISFLGWFTDPALTTKADFSTPIGVDTTLYASWAVLAETGVSVSPWAIPGAVGGVLLGIALITLSRRRSGRATS